MRRTAELGLMLALALILSYVESLIPFSFGIPGIKLGLPNLAIVFALYRLGWKDACAVSMPSLASALRRRMIILQIWAFCEWYCHGYRGGASKEWRTGKGCA